MPSNDPNAKNAAGLTPSETKGLRERQPEAHEEKILSKASRRSVPSLPRAMTMKLTIFAVEALHL